MRRARFVAAFLLVASAIVIYSARTTPIVTVTDFAVSQVYVELATRGELLLGPYSRYGWHHPGPLYFYIIAPFYALAGHQAAALYAVALTINLVSLVTIGWVIARESRGVLAIATVAALLVVCWRADRFLASPWNAHVAILPAMAALVLAAAVSSGRLYLLWLFAVFASFAIQTHVGFAPSLALIGLTATATGMVRARGVLHSPWRPVTIASSIVLLLWFPVVLEAAGHEGGNIAELWKFFIADSVQAKPVGDALALGGYSLASIARHDFGLEWSAQVRVTETFTFVLVALVAFVALIATAWYDAASGRRFDAALALVALLATTIGVWGMTQIRGEVLHYDLMRLAPVGAIDFAIVAVAAARLAAGRRPGLVRGAQATPYVLGLVLTAAVVLGARHLDSLSAFERRGSRYRTTEAYRAVSAYVAQHNVKRLRLQMGPNRWSETAGVLARLVAEGVPVELPADHLIWFTPRFAPTGEADAVIFIADPEFYQELRNEGGNVVLLEAPPLYVVAKRLGPAPGK